MASTTVAPRPARGLAAVRTLPHRLYSGEVSYDFLARRRRWYLISAVVLLVSFISIGVRGFNSGIDFAGGSTYQLPKHGHTVSQAREAVAVAGVTDAQIQTVGNGQFLVTTKKTSDPKVVNKIVEELSARLGVKQTDVAVSTVGGTWGSEITKKAVEGLIIFLIGVVLYITIAFRAWKMAAAAFVALLHDLIVTAGVYSLVGFEVTPSTVIAVLTILGFSLYDTVVVFDKVRENTARLQSVGKVTYGQAANLALNQTLVRSINTSLIALIPVGSLLFVGAGLLGAGTLKDLALAQFIGLASGAYSSIFIATPLLVQLKEREPQMQALAARVARAEAAGKPSVLGRRPGYTPPAVPGAPDGSPGGEDQPEGHARPAVPDGDGTIEAATVGSGSVGSMTGRPVGPARPPARKRGRGRPHGKRRR
jgi:preprotein translocase subunit SecF